MSAACCAAASDSTLEACAQQAPSNLVCRPPGRHRSAGPVTLHGVKRCHNQRLSSRSPVKANACDLSLPDEPWRVFIPALTSSRVFMPTLNFCFTQRID
ncbi:hypothetical protein [Pandoraea sputorum]|uniref:hypothetical protein n=1 Tax=Pandoraea sputorum TaxID=93222 RepID=UPI001781DEE2|nr:hypothetical protein [Pandoraea sputorum]